MKKDVKHMLYVTYDAKYELRQDSVGTGGTISTRTRLGGRAEDDVNVPIKVFLECEQLSNPSISARYGGSIQCQSDLETRLATKCRVASQRCNRLPKKPGLAEPSGQRGYK